MDNLPWKLKFGENIHPETNYHKMQSEMDACQSELLHAKESAGLVCDRFRHILQRLVDEKNLDNATFTMYNNVINIYQEDLNAVDLETSSDLPQALSPEYYYGSGSPETSIKNELDFIEHNIDNEYGSYNVEALLSQIEKSLFLEIMMENNLTTMTNSPDMIRELRKINREFEGEEGEKYLEGNKVLEDLVFLSGKPFSQNAIARINGYDIEQVIKMRETKQLLGIPDINHGFLYPAFQFVEDGNVLSGFSEVLEILNCDDIMKLQWLQTRNITLEGQTPLEILKSGDVNSVINAARNYGEQRAS
jgi:hypothetical protein